MKNKAYKVKDMVSDCTGFEKETVYIPLQDLLLRRDMSLDVVRLAFEWEKGKSQHIHNAHTVFRSILVRTLEYHQIMERVTKKEIVEGSPERSIPPSMLERKAVERAVDALVEVGLLTRIREGRKQNGKFVYNRNTAPLLSLNSNLFDLLARVEAEKLTWMEQSGRKPHYHARPAMEKLEALLKAYEQGQRGHVMEYLSAIGDHGTPSFEAFQDEILLLQNPEAVRKATILAAAKRSMRGKAGLKYWNMRVQERREDYPHAKLRQTAKLQGMMTKLIKELESVESLTNKQQRALIDDVVEFWKGFGGCTFSMGRFRTVTRVPDDPDFEFYHTHRADLARLIEQAVENVRGMDLSDLEPLEGHEPSNPYVL